MIMEYKVAVLLPCYNEEKNIGKVVRDFREVLPSVDIYVYNNNSTDRTVEEATASGAIVRHEYTQGKGNVIHRMFREVEADCYLMADGDDTYPAHHAPDMVKEVLEKQADMVIGDRLSSTYFTQNKRPFHNFGNRLDLSLICHLWHTKVKDIITGYRAFSRSFVKLYPVMSGQFEVETEMTIHALDKNFRLVEIPIDYRDRPEGSNSKLNTFSDGFKVLRAIFTLFKEYRLMRFFGWLAVLLAVVGTMLVVPVLMDYFDTGLVLRFPTLFVSLFLFLTALQSLFTGLCLDVMVTKDRKQYELQLINS
jgi:glycosyltransferase involved in cell wall biosynthesis